MNDRQTRRSAARKQRARKTTAPQPRRMLSMHIDRRAAGAGRGEGRAALSRSRAWRRNRPAAEARARMRRTAETPIRQPPSHRAAELPSRWLPSRRAADPPSQRAATEQPPSRRVPPPSCHRAADARARAAAPPSCQAGKPPNEQRFRATALTRSTFRVSWHRNGAKRHRQVTTTTKTGVVRPLLQRRRPVFFLPS